MPKTSALAKATPQPQSPAISKLSAALALTCCSLITSVQADTIFGVYFGGGVWQNQYSGNITLKGDTIDLENDFNFDKEDNSYAYVAIEHPIPLLPNIRLAQTQVLAQSNSVLTRSITFNDQNYLFSNAINSELDLSFIDATFYYEVLDNWLSLDLGITARNFDGFAKIENSTIGVNRYDFNETLPLLYISAQAQLPLTGLSVQASLQGIGVSDSNLTDTRIGLGYESSIGLGGELGYRSMNIKIDDLNDLNSDVQTKGLYLGMTYHF